MAGIGDLLGASGVIEQLLLWNVVGQVVTNLMSPAFNALQQDVLAKHPNMVITPDVLSRAVVQSFMSKAAAETEAAKSGLDGTRFNVLLNLATIRLSPEDLAEAVLRSYLDTASAERTAKEQGIDAEQFKVLTLLAGDGIGPQQAAEALRRGIIKDAGAGPDSTSYEQAIAESRLHNKWGRVLYDLTRALLSPPDAAEAVVRGFLARDAGEALAALSGVDASTFGVMVSLGGDAPSPTTLTEALRREIIPRDSGSPSKPGFIQGIREGRLADQWAPVLEALAQEWPTPTDALEARLVGQVTDAKSQELYKLFGGDPKYWQLLMDTRGESPTPLELITMRNRGYIPWNGTGPNVTSYEQGFNEGRWRDKWRDVYRKFADYVPPEGTVIGLLSHDVITDADAAKYLTQQGMSPKLVAAFIENAHLESLSEVRGASISMVLQAYYEQIITSDQATDWLKSLHATDTAISLMLAYEDDQRSFTAINGAVTRIRTLYASRKITVETARSSLTDLGIKHDAAASMLKSWAIENSVSVKVLTEAQIANAFEHTIMTPEEALAELVNIGYTPYDAWVILSIKIGGPLPGKPKRGPAPPQDQVIGGTT